MTGKTTLFIVLLATVAVAAAFAFGPAGTRDAQGQDAAKYVSGKKCAMCHAEQTETWNAMKHSKAWSSLTADQIASGKDDKGRACVSCHSTGYDKGGFTTFEATPDLANVGCEACHGAGSQHIQTMMMAAMNDEKPENKKIVKGADCTQCHNPHISYKALYGAK